MWAESVWAEIMRGGGGRTWQKQHSFQPGQHRLLTSPSCHTPPLPPQGFSEPTDIQKECLPAAIRDKKDIIGAAQTGSGKTLAFGLPIMQVLLQVRPRVEVWAEVRCGSR